MRAQNVDWTIWQQPAVASEFADRRSSVPGTAAQLDIMRRLIGRVPGEAVRVFDLGCGDGFLLAEVMKQCEVSLAVALDGSEPMLQRARHRFGGDERVRFVHANFNLPHWRNELPASEFDVIVSGFAIHHSENQRKRELYEELFGLLAPGGVFINIEHVASSSPLGEDLWLHAWAEYDVAYRRAQGEQIDHAAAVQEHRASEQKAANRLAPVETQLQWLRDIGFSDVDYYWKYLELAVLAGRRRT